MNEEEQLRRAEEFFDQFLTPTPGVPVLAKAESPKISSLQKWREDAVRLGFDPEDVRLVFDGECFGVEVPAALIDASLDEFW